jgi:hypothetical protein
MDGILSFVLALTRADSLTPLALLPQAAQLL